MQLTDCVRDKPSPGATILHYYRNIKHLALISPHHAADTGTYIPRKPGVPKTNFMRKVIFTAMLENIFLRRNISKSD